MDMEFTQEWRGPTGLMLKTLLGEVFLEFSCNSVNGGILFLVDLDSSSASGMKRILM